MQKFIIKMLVGVGVFIVWNMVGGVAEVKAQFVVHKPVVQAGIDILCIGGFGDPLPDSAWPEGKALIRSLKEGTVEELGILNKGFYTRVGGYNDLVLCSFTSGSVKVLYREVKKGSLSKKVPLYFWWSESWSRLKLSELDSNGEEIPLYEMLGKKLELSLR